MSTTEIGRCLCGKVELHTESKGKHVGACHCNMCRRWGGGPFMEVNCGADVTFTGEENVKTFSSSDWAERGFCANCGSHLFYKLKPTGEYMVPVGLFEDDAALEFNNQVFIDEKPGFYNFSEDTEKLTGEELFAKFSPPSE